MGEYPARAADEEDTLDRELQVAHLLFRCGRLLEPGGRRSVWLPHQSARGLVLHAGPELDPGPWTHRVVWCVRDARSRFDALLLARADARAQVEGGTSEAVV